MGTRFMLLYLVKQEITSRYLYLLLSFSRVKLELTRSSGRESCPVIHTRNEVPLGVVSNV